MDAQSHNAWIERTDGTQVPLKGTCSIGRARNNHVVLNDEKASRRHAFLHGQGDAEWVLVDQGSSNGSYINDRRVAQPTLLRDGDRVQIGDSVLVFRQPSRTDGTRNDLDGDITIIGIRAKPCWLLLADIEASTELAKKIPPEELVLMVGKWFASCKQLIEDFQGTINKYLGDGYFAYWPDDPGMELRIRDAVAGLRRLQGHSRPPFRLVVHFGRVTMGGVPSMGEESLSGADVNFIFRMEKLAGALKVPLLLSEAAMTRLNCQTEVQDLGRHGLAGFSGDYLFYRW